MSRPYCSEPQVGWWIHCNAIRIPRKYGCVCVALFEGGRQNTTGNSILAVTKKIIAVTRNNTAGRP
jgi:hypothetical protein